MAIGGAGAKVVQVTNIAPQATKDQMQTLFGYLGKIEDIRLYPTLRDVACPVQSRICYIKFMEAATVGVAQHMTNTVFIDRALIVIPISSGDIPDEYFALEMTRNGTIVPGLHTAEPNLPPNVINSVVNLESGPAIVTYDPKLEASGLPPYPPLPSNYDTHQIEEIRRTVVIVDVDPTISSEAYIEFFTLAGEVKYLRQCTRPTDLKTYMLVEFSDQPSIKEVLKMNGMDFNEKPIQIVHSTQAIVKPQAKSNEAAQREIEEAMSRVKEAQNLISATIDPVIGMLSKDKRRRSRSRSRGRHRRSRSRSRSRRRSRSRQRSRRSRSRSRKRSKSRDRKRSKSRDRKRSKSRDRKRRSKSASRKRSRSRSRRHSRTPTSKSHKSRSKSRSRSSRRERSRYKSKERAKSRDKSKEKERSGSSRDKDDKDKSGSASKDREKDRERDREKSRDKSHAKSKERDRDSRDSKERRSDKESTAEVEEKRIVKKVPSRSPSRQKYRSRSRDRKRTRSRERRSRSRGRRRSPSPRKPSRKRSRSRSRDRKRDKRDKRDRRERTPSLTKATRNYDEEERGYDERSRKKDYTNNYDADVPREKDCDAKSDNMDISNSP